MDSTKGYQIDQVIVDWIDLVCWVICLVEAMLSVVVEIHPVFASAVSGVSLARSPYKQSARLHRSLLRPYEAQNGLFGDDV
ncbi:MAG: hypothetical protein J4G19_01650 [Pseudomonadales bacterium]|nr:hypothetical protein [Pseudomonadales bacterium]